MHNKPIVKPSPPALVALKPGQSESAQRVKLTPQHAAWLRSMFEDRAIGTAKFLKTTQNLPPADLTHEMIEGWIRDRDQKTTRPLKSHWEYVTAEIEAHEGLIELTPQILDELRQLLKQRRLGIQRLLQGRTDLPRGLTTQKASYWLSKSNSDKQACKSHWDYVMNLLRQARPVPGYKPSLIERSKPKTQAFHRTAPTYSKEPEPS